MVTKFSSWECTRPYDHLYGLMGLIAHYSDGNSPLDYNHVDYDRSFSDVILDAIFKMRMELNLNAYSTTLNTLADTKFEKKTIPDVFYSPGKPAAWKTIAIPPPQTTQRHKDLARKTLRVLEAPNYTPRTPDISQRRSSIYLLFSSPIESLSKTHFSPNTHEQTSS